MVLRLGKKRGLLKRVSRLCRHLKESESLDSNDELRFKVEKDNLHDKGLNIRNKDNIEIENEVFSSESELTSDHKSDKDNKESHKKEIDSTVEINYGRNKDNHQKEKKDVPKDQKSKKIKKFHLNLEEAENKIAKLEEEIKSLEGPNNANKRKRVYQKVVKLKQALQNPEEFVVNPQQEQEKVQKDKERRTKKKLEKSQKLKEEQEKTKSKKKHTICNICKKRGHTAIDCREAGDGAIKYNISSSICYKCGSKKHTLKDCTQKGDSDLKFATCFFCKQSGHISRDCPQNEQGIYFKGGSCFGCGSTRHLAKECPVRNGTAEKNE